MRESLKLLKYIKPEWKKVIIGFVFMLFFAFFSGISIGMIIPLMDNVFTPKAQVETYQEITMTQALGEFSQEVKTYIKEHRGQENWIEDTGKFMKDRGVYYLNNVPPLEILKFVVIAIIILFLLKNIFFYLNKLIFVIVENKVTMNLRNDLYRKFQSLSMSFFHKNPTGQVSARLFNDINVINSLTINVFAKIVRDILMVILYAGIAIYLSAGLFVYILIVIPPVVYLVTLLTRKLRKYSGRRQRKIADIYSIVQDTIPGIQIVKAFTMEDYEVRRFKKQNHKYYKYMNKLNSYNLMSIPLSDISGAIIASFVLWYGGSKILSPDTALTTGRFFAFLGAIFSMINPMKNIIKLYSDIQNASVAVKRVFDIFEIESDIKEAESPVLKDTFDNNILFENVKFHYNAGEEVLRGIDLEIKKGEVVAFIGPSGGGKTTLVDLLPRFYDPVSGRILLDGIDLKNIPIKKLREMLGIVTQEVILFNDSVYNNIAYGLEGVPEERVIEACKAANAFDFIQKLPKGFDSQIGERGCNLSGGQKQRIAIARAILKNPPILIFDEATSSLDTESESLVQQAINNLIKNRTALVIAHRLSTITNADKIVVIEDGSIIELGTHFELYSEGTRYKQLYDLQFKQNNDQSGTQTDY
ncbi:ABC transporter ATP-binding protein [bacterium]|nr:ABC transporter ATP-binding protein [bacterium]